ncbi:MAG: histidinol-phosphatase HisJ family protein [Clostridia bacterium]|nr:histidinol-phosphatase HisJ family protein [Clostridia bacterium]
MYETHAHTRPFSPDAKQNLEDLVAASRSIGLEGLVVTEHMDPDLDKGLMVFDVAAYIQAMDAARSTLPSGFRLLNGIEAGYQPHLAERYRTMSGEFPFDHVIGSVHALDGEDIYFVQDVFGRGRDAVYGAYLDQLCDMAADGDWFDVVGHYDYVTRFSGYPDPRLTYREQSERFDRLFRLMIGNGKSLELNARSIRAMERIGVPDPMPDPDVFRRYRELGGELVTIGSDAHAPDEVALYAGRIRDYLASVGFARTFVFIDRKPVPVPFV